MKMKHGSSQLKYLIVFLFLWDSLAFGQSDPITQAWNQYHAHPDSSKHILEQELTRSRKEKNHRNEGKCLSYLGVIMDIEGNSKEAVKNLLQAIRIQEKYRFEKDLSFSYNNLGVAHFYQNNYNIAITYYRKSFEIDSARNDRTGAAGTLVNIGVVYTYLDKFAQAEQNYLEARDIYEQLHDSLGLCSVYNNLAKIAFERHHFLKAIKLYHQSIASTPGHAGIEVTFTPYYGLANSHIRLQRYPEAIRYARTAIDMAQSVQARERLQYGYEILAEAESGAGNYQEAFKALQQYTDLRDSILNKASSDAIAEMEVKYRDEQRDNELLEVKSNKLEQEKNIEVFKSTLTISLSIIVLLIVISLLFWQRQKASKRNASLLKERNEAIQENLKQKEMMIGEIHHRVKNNLQLISSIIDLHARTLEEGKERDVLLDSRKRVESIAIVHQKLYQSDEIFAIELNEYFNDLGQTILHHFPAGNNPVSLVVKSLTPLHVHIDSAIPLGLILAELITNSLKYAFHDIEYPLISVELVKNHQYFLLVYKDNGKSFDIARWNNGTSFGKRMIGSLIRQLKAQADYSGQDGFKAQINCLNIIWKSHE